MVLLPKQWKSRSPPGFEASVRQENPFAMLLFNRVKVPKPQASQGQTAARTPDSIRGRIAKLADASAGA